MRRITVVVLLAFAAALAATGIATAEPIEVIWWDFFTGGDGARMRAMIDEFNSTHADIQIVPTTLEWGTPFYAKILTSAAVGEQPDIMTYHLSRYPLAMQLNALTPITAEELASVGLATADFQPGLIETVTYDGQLYGVPFDIHASVLYYNAEILAEAGLLGEDGKPVGLDGIDNFNAALAKLKDLGYQPLAISTSADPATEWRIYYSMVRQMGGEILDGDRVVSDEKTLGALQTMIGWIDQGYVLPNVDYVSNIALFTNGQAAMMINGVWEVPTMVDLQGQDQLFQWGAVPLPTWFEQPANWADAHTFAIPNSPVRPLSPEKRQAVLEIIAWFVKNGLTWAGGGHIPAYKPVTESPEYQAMEPNASYVSLADHMVFDPKSPLAGVASPIFDAVQNYFEPALNGQLDAESALQMFVDEVQSQMW